MERHCHICRYSFALLIPIIHNEYLATQINTLFDLNVESSGTAFFVCHQCKEIVDNMHEFYLHVKKTQSFFPDITDEEKPTYCRLCASCYEDLPSIFDISLLPKKIHKLFKIKVMRKDTLPTVICEPCQEILTNNWKIYADMETRKKNHLNEKLPNYNKHDFEYVSEISNFEFQGSPSINNEESFFCNYETSLNTLKNLSAVEETYKQANKTDMHDSDDKTN